MSSADRTGHSRNLAASGAFGSTAGSRIEQPNARYGRSRDMTHSFVSVGCQVLSGRPIRPSHSRVTVSSLSTAVRHPALRTAVDIRAIPAPLVSRPNLCFGKAGKTALSRVNHGGCGPLTLTQCTLDAAGGRRRSNCVANSVIQVDMRLLVIFCLKNRVVA